MRLDVGCVRAMEDYWWFSFEQDSRASMTGEDDYHSWLGWLSQEVWHRHEISRVVVWSHMWQEVVAGQVRGLN